MSTLRELAESVGVPDDDADLRKLVAVFLETLRAHGRVNHRGLLASLRRRLDDPATELAQETALLLRRKLRLLPPKVNDLESVRRALDAEAPGEVHHDD